MSSASTPRRVVLYARTSQDTSDGRSVDDQLAELRKWADRTGRNVVASLRDDGISASRYARRTTSRPAWAEAMDLITTQQVDELAVWEISRSTRERAVWSALIAACIENDVDLAVDGKVHDPADPDDGFMLDLGAALAVRESAVISKRTRRAVNSRAAAGRPHGSLPYGYRRVLDPVTGKAVARELHPDQAPIVTEIAQRLLNLEPANAIAADLNRRGVPTATGKQWRPGNMTLLALRPAYAGLRVHHGQVLADVKATWPPIISELDHYRLLAMHRDAARDKFRHPTYAKHLGSGIYRCGREGCDGRMRVVVQSGGRPNRYDCRACHKVSRHQDPVDELVNETVWRWLVGPAQNTMARVGDDSMKRAADEAARLRLKLREARALVAADRLSLESLVDIEAKTLPKIRVAEEQARPRHAPPRLHEVAAAGDAARDVWFGLPIRDRRSIVAWSVDVLILPAGRGKWKFDRNDVVITPRG